MEGEGDCMITLSRMVCSARKIVPELGTINGICVYCGEETEHGHFFEPTGQFTTYQLIQGGTTVCEHCNVLKSSQDYRRSMWIVNESEFIAFAPKEAKHYLQYPLAPPFVMYMTQTWKKQGWPGLVNRINNSKNNFIVGYDYELVHVEARKRDEYLEFAQRLIDIGITKTEMSTGQLKAKSYALIDYDIETIEKLTGMVQDPLWDLCVYATRKDYDK